MNKTKAMLIGFAFFASMMMLSTSCIAGPVEASVSLETIESAENELVNSIEALFLKMKNDRYLNSLKDQISKDRTLNSIASAIENTDDFDVKASLASSYLDALKNNQVFNNLAAYFERSYSKDMQGINAQFNTFSDVFEAYQSTNTEETEEDTLMIVGVHNLNFGSQNDEDTSDTSSETGNKGTVYTCNGGTVQAITGNVWFGPIDSAEAQRRVVFLCNMNGEIYLPGYGWLDPGTNGFWSWIFGIIWAIINPILVGNLLKFILRLIVRGVIGAILGEMELVLNWFFEFIKFLAGWPLSG